MTTENNANLPLIQNEDRYFVIREDMIPEGMLKTVQAKELLIRGQVATIHEAVEQVGLSRSAFYKYKDSIYPYHRKDKQIIATISMELLHRSGILSKVLSTIASVQGNVLTIHQTIPLQEKAHVVITLETSMMKDSIKNLVQQLQELDGVRRIVIISQTES